MIKLQLHIKQARGEPITIEHFVIDTVKSVIMLVVNKSESSLTPLSPSNIYLEKDNVTC